jgi:hypothetical protein
MSTRLSTLRKLPIVRLLAWILAGGICVVLALWVFFPLRPPDPRCVALLATSGQSVQVPIPSNCVETDAVPEDAVVRYLENERKQRGLIFKSWIRCKPSSETAASAFDFARDPRWLPSYKPLCYQFRRTIVILPYAQPQESPVAAEVCLTPKPRYLSQIAGQCDGKFAVWK